MHRLSLVLVIPAIAFHRFFCQGNEFTGSVSWRREKTIETFSVGRLDHEKKKCAISNCFLLSEKLLYQCRFPGVPHKGNLIREVENIHFLFLLMTSTTWNLYHAHFFKVFSTAYVLILFKWHLHTCAAMLCSVFNRTTDITIWENRCWIGVIKIDFIETF